MLAHDWITSEFTAVVSAFIYASKKNTAWSKMLFIYSDIMRHLLSIQRPSVWSYDSTCAEVQQYSLTVSNSSGGVVLVTNTALTSLSLGVPEDVQYTISLRATTVCGSSSNTVSKSNEYTRTIPKSKICFLYSYQSRKQLLHHGNR